MLPPRAMVPALTEPDVTPAVRRFRGERERSHALFASLAVGVFWLGHVLFVRYAIESSDPTDLLSLPWFGWWVLGFSAVPWAMRGVDDAIARARGDERPLHRPYMTFLGALLGSLAWFPIVLALSTFSPERSLVSELFRFDGLLFSMMGLGAIVGAWPFARRCVPLEVTVGADAVRYVVGQRARMVPLRDIAKVQHAPHRFILLRRDESPLEMDLRETDIDEEALFDALQSAVALSRQPVPHAAALQRGDRSLDDWRGALRVTGMGMDGLRGRHLDASRLAEVITHPGSTKEERIGAALALRTHDEGRGVRVRLAAEPVMDPATRQALEAIAAGDESPAVLERALRG